MYVFNKYFNNANVLGISLKKLIELFEQFYVYKKK